MSYLEEGREVVGLMGSYTVERALPKSGFGRAFAAHDASGARVLLKEVHVGDLDAWKRVDALEREARATSHLRSPRIARFIELFAYDGALATKASDLSRPGATEALTDAKAPSLVLARAFVEGTTLAEAIREQRRFTADELERIFRDLLEARKYLDSLMPAVVHGDVSPANVIVDPNGRAWMIDFGSVCASPTSSPSAAVGTSGFMPPEQMAGHATPASDLYAIAVCLLTAASHKPAHELPIDNQTMRIEVARATSGLPSPMVRALVACIEPSIASRAKNAEEVLHLLDGGSRFGFRVLETARRRAPQSRRAVIVAGAVLAAFLPGALSTLPLSLRKRHAIAAAPPIIVESPPVVLTAPHESPAPAAPPLAAPPPPPPPPTFQWVGRVEHAKSGSSEGEPCALSIEANPADLSEGCRVSLVCGDHAVVRGVLTTQCSLVETVIGPSTSVYRASLTHEPSELGDVTSLALDGKTGLLRATRVDESGKTLEDLTVKLEPRSLPVASGLSGTPQFEKRSRFKGTVVRASGAERVKEGDACSYDLGPSGEADPSDGAEQNCKAIVKCGGQTLYEGFGSCTLGSDGAPIDMSDVQASPLDGDPTLIVTGHELTIGDNAPRGRLDVLVYLEVDPNPSSDNE